jgi:hypothetical protein
VNFNITQGKGFSIKFANGISISVQFGPGNYCDNYDMRIGQEDVLSGKIGSTTAECAVIDRDGNLIELPNEWGGYNVTNRSMPEEVLALMNWAAKLAPVDSGEKEA